MIRPQADVSHGPAGLPKDWQVRTRQAFTGRRGFSGRDRACLETRRSWDRLYGRQLSWRHTRRGATRAVTRIGKRANGGVWTFRWHCPKGPGLSTGCCFSPRGRNGRFDRVGKCQPLSGIGSGDAPGASGVLRGAESARSLVLARLTSFFYPMVIHKATKFCG
jgi:hypothetical protein